MPTEEEQEQQRRKRLDELELYEKTQEKLLVWGKRRFWWVIAFGGLIVGSGGYAVVDKMLSGVTDNANTAMIKAQLAAEEITKAKDAATEAVANAKKATTESTQAATQSAAATTQAAAASKLARQSVDDLARALKEFEAQSQQLASANEQLRKDLEAARSRFESDVAGLLAGAASIRAKADPEDDSLQRLIKQLNESQSLTERAAAATALGQRGEHAKTAIDDLEAAFHNVRPTELESEEDKLALAIARAIAQIAGEDALPFLLEVMADSGATFEQRAAASEALAAVPVWSKQGVEKLRSSFGKLGVAVRNDIVEAFMNYDGPFADEAVRATVLDLLIHALENERNMQNAAYAIYVHFANDGEKALPALRKALTLQDSPPVRRTIQSAIAAIEGKKQD